MGDVAPPKIKGQIVNQSSSTKSNSNRQAISLPPPNTNLRSHGDFLGLQDPKTNRSPEQFYNKKLYNNKLCHNAQHIKIVLY